MHEWLHFYHTKRITHNGQAFVSEWAFRRADGQIARLKSTNKDWVRMNAEFFAQKHKLLLFVHAFNGEVEAHYDCRSGPTMNISKDFKTHYNETMTNNLVREIPNLNHSTNVKSVGVRAVFKDKEEPLHLNVIVFLHSGQKVKFKKEARYLFPTSELIAKIGLLL